MIIAPFGEVQGAHIWEGWGGFPPEVLLGTAGGWMITTGFRVYLGGEPMRMGSYGMLDAMTPRVAG